MNLEAVLCAARILRSQPAHTLPLRTLHERLRGELGAQAGSYAQIYHQLKNLPHSFVMMDAPQLLQGTEVWPAELREEYSAALEGAGLGSCVRVALAEAPSEEPRGGAVDLASKTVSELWALAGGDLVMREYLSSAAHQLEEISLLLSADAEAERPTTHPRDLPQ